MQISGFCIMGVLYLVKKNKQTEYGEIADEVLNIEAKNFWMWVTSPGYYMDSDGSEKSILEPVHSLEWTCSEDTLEGDLIFLYRTSPKTDVKYLIQAVSDAFPVEENGKFSGWHHCDCKFIYKYENSVLSKEMKNNMILLESDPVRRNYQGNKGSFELLSDEWFELNSMLKNKNPDYSTFLNTIISQNTLLESSFPI